jgi:predicted secreted Zn-dependent protease
VKRSSRKGFQTSALILVIAMSLQLGMACTNNDGAGAQEASATPALSAPAPQVQSPNLTPAASSNRLDCGVLLSTGSRTDAERQFFSANCTTTTADRTSCASISGSAYRSDAERNWYLTNCVPTPAPVANTPTPVTAQRPAALPTQPSQSCGDTEITVTTEFDRENFTVTGLTLEALNASLSANGPSTPEGPAAGVTQYTLSIATARCVSASACRLGLASLKATGKIILPKHSAEASLGADIRPIWTRFVSDTTIHEDRHVTIVREGLEDAKRQLLAVPPAENCADLDRAVADVWRFSVQAIDRRQESFHVADRYGVGGVIVP